MLKLRKGILKLSQRGASPNTFIARSNKEEKAPLSVKGLLAGITSGDLSSAP